MASIDNRKSPYASGQKPARSCDEKIGGVVARNPLGVVARNPLGVVARNPLEVVARKPHEIVSRKSLGIVEKI